MPAALLAAALLTGQGTIFASPTGNLGLAISGRTTNVAARLWGHDDAGREVTLWKRNLAGRPGASLVSDSGTVALLDVPYAGGDHAVMILAPDGRLLADLALKELLDPAEIARLTTDPATARFPAIRIWRKEGTLATLGVPEFWHYATTFRRVKGVGLITPSAEVLSIPTALGPTIHFNAFTGTRWKTDASGRLDSQPPK